MWMQDLRTLETLVLILRCLETTVKKNKNKNTEHVKQIKEDRKTGVLVN